MDDDPVVLEYRKRAAEVEKMAAAAISQDYRKSLLEIAVRWRALAEQRILDLASGKE